MFLPGCTIEEIYHLAILRNWILNDWFNPQYTSAKPLEWFLFHSGKKKKTSSACTTIVYDRLYLKETQKKTSFNGQLLQTAKIIIIFHFFSKHNAKDLIKSIIMTSSRHRYFNYWWAITCLLHYVNFLPVYSRWVLQMLNLKYWTS